jgi:hypothetical protein
MNRVFNWLSAYRRPIGYTIAALNIVGGVNDIINGNVVIGVAMVLLGAFIAVDARAVR